MADVERFPGSKAVKSTGAALLVEMPGWGQQWVPQKAIHDDSEVWNCTDGSEGTLVVHAWWWTRREMELRAKDRAQLAKDRVAALTARHGGGR